MSETPRFSLPFLETAQAQKEVTHNEALAILDAAAQAWRIESRSLAAPPGGESEGQAWIVAASASGAWAGHEGQIALWLAGWRFLAAQPGMLAWVGDEQILLQRGAAAWQVLAGSSGGLPDPGAGGLVVRSDPGATAARTLTAGQGVAVADGNGVAGNPTVSVPSVLSAAGDTGTVGTTHNRGLFATDHSRASGNRTAVVACGGTDASDNGNEATGTHALVLGSTNGNRASASGALVLGARRVVNNVTRSLAGGNASSGDLSTANRKWHLHGDSGDLQLAGTLTSSHGFADYAEFFENLTSGPIPLGAQVVLDGDRVRPATAADEPADLLGVVSATAGIALGDTPFAWQGRYLTGDFGERLQQMVPDADWEPTEGRSEADRPLVAALIENPAWDPSLPQIPRSQRPDDWTLVALLGQVHGRITAPVAPGAWLAPDGSPLPPGQRSRLKVMRVTKAYDEAAGWGVALCLLR